MSLRKKCRTYVELDDNSRQALRLITNDFDRNDWKFYGDHMTVVYGKRFDTLNLSQNLGDEVKLIGTHLGSSENCIALKVSGFYSFNDIAHVTLLVNQKNNSTPVMSNNIERWEKLETEIALYGKLIELY